MSFADVIEKLEGHAVRSADAEAELRQPAEMLFLIPETSERLKRIRMWSLIVVGALILSIWSDMEASMEPVLRGMLGTTVFGSIGTALYIWTTAKLGRLRAIALMLKAQAANDAEMRDDLKRLNQHLHEQTTAQLAAQAAASAMQASAPAPAPEYRPDNRHRIRELQNRMESLIRMMPSDPYQAARAKAEIATLESKLRSLGA